MSFMTEKKAQEIFQQYLKAEEDGNDGLAIGLEEDLNKAGWYIVSGPDGLTIQKKESTLPTIDTSLLPSESTIKPTASETVDDTGSSGRTIWIVVGVVAGAAMLTIAAILIIKHFKNVRS